MSRISTLQLKWITAVCLVLAFGLMLTAPAIIGRPDRQHARSAVRRIALLGAGLTVAALGAGVGAFLIMRREQERYREMAVRNMQALIEGAREDRAKKLAGEDGEPE